MMKSMAHLPKSRQVEKEDPTEKHKTGLFFFFLVDQLVLNN